MPFLLLLSALLTALTGAVTGVRSVEISTQCPAAAVDAHRIVAAAGPILAGHLHLLGTFGVTASFALDAAAPIVRIAAPRFYLDRPRA
ncbi:hypothetical protein U1872_14720 [Sphingomonas sp. RB3P16]|uniref:hypothetical protein n=1 Tax=Parasphingomonas frigoris TaxID=3096163 RepID=UPI002FC909D8